MCCVLSLLIFIGPRIAGIAWYLTDSARWNAAFSNILWPIAGLIFLPWTTMAWVFMSSNGVSGLDWIVVALAFLLDVGAFGGGGYSRRHRG
ncbi:MAG: hypothetical protein KA170_02970 [Candidatus Promineofilum sp.]|nr:hypothetical protein [Promineifilum sp.]